MARLYLFAEGETEETFADTILKRHLANHGVFCIIRLRLRHARRRGRAHRGGGRSYEPMKDDILRFPGPGEGRRCLLHHHDRLVCHPPGVPEAGRIGGVSPLPSPAGRVLERAFADDVADRALHPVHPTCMNMRLIFSPIPWFAYFYDREKEIAALQAIADAHATPELIDDGPNSAPSKRIIAQIPEYELAKTVVGPQVAVDRPGRHPSQVPPLPCMVVPTGMLGP